MSLSTIKRKQSPPSKTNNQLFSPAVKTPKLDEGTLTIKTVLSEMRLMEERLQAKNQEVLDRLSRELSLVEAKLLSKIECEIQLIQERVNHIEDRIASIESELTTVDRLSNDIETLRKEIYDIKAIEDRKSEKDITSDAIIFGIEYIEGENLKTIFNQVSRFIDFLPPPVRDIFRVRPKNQLNQNSAVVVKFYTPFDRNRCLKAFSEYRRRTNGPVSMRSAGFNSELNFRIYESLTSENRKLLQLAVKYKKERKLVSAFSIRGKIHVRLAFGSDALQVNDENDLEHAIQK